MNSRCSACKRLFESAGAYGPPQKYCRSCRLQVIRQTKRESHARIRSVGTTELGPELIRKRGVPDFGAEARAVAAEKRRTFGGKKASARDTAYMNGESKTWEAEE
jgi:hypothetical protein